MAWCASTTARRASTTASESAERDERGIDDDAALGRLHARFGVGFEPALGLGEPLLEELGPLAEAGRADLEIATTAGEHRGPRVDRGANLVTGAGRLGLGRLAGFEVGHESLELVDAGPLDLELAGELVEAPLERFELDLDLSALGLRPGEALGRMR